MIDLLALVVSGLVGCSLFIKLTWSIYKRWRTRNASLLPGDWPLIGHILSMRDQRLWEQTKMKYYEENDGIVGIMFTHFPVFMTRRIDIWEDLLSNQKHLRKGFGYVVFEKIIGKGLLTSDGELWRKRRKMITPAFHFDILNDFITVMESKTLNLIGYLKKAYSTGEQFDTFKVTKPYSMSIICKTSMGLDYSIEETSTGSFKHMYEETISLLYSRLLNPLFKSDWLYSFTKNGKEFERVKSDLSKFIKDVIETRIRVRNVRLDEATLTKKRIFIDIMLDAYENEEIDVEGILDEINTFVNAGYETTSTALAWCLYCLGRNQRVQDKLHEELLQFKKSKFNQIQDFKEFIYLDLVIKETMRLHPTILRFSRDIPDGTVLGGITFPACTVAIDTKFMNHNPEIWENPMEFIPERFENFEENKRSAFMYIPFSAGPRNCIGQRFAMLELKIALYHLIRTFRVTSLQKESELKGTYGFTHGCEGGLFVSLEERKKI